jgi:hypothetical protein
MFGPESALFQEGIARQQATVETIVTAALGSPVRIAIQGAAAAAAADAKPRRMSATDLRNERLTELRRKDPALDAAAAALDLELIDDQ